MAQDGDLKNLYPPGNNGTSRGVGMIDGDDGKNYVFQTPTDNNNHELALGSISFTLSENGKHIESVSQTSDDLLGGG
ncbi:MAG: hypothetical protein COA97_09410 [Flavobacteriales bacterium]|nr:MAG: hypothetical protein COA97_09410 [Flavobacteriales bacterium]